MNIRCKLDAVARRPKGKVQLVLKSTEWEPPVTFTCTVSVTNDLAIGCTLGDEYTMKLERVRK